jgi:hypothetical protein
MKLPDKPQQVAHVSDALWEAALDAAYAYWRGLPDGILFRLTIDHARLLIMQGEVEEPIDPLDAALDALWDSWSGAWVKCQMKTAIRKHLAGMTIPEPTQ